VLGTIHYGSPWPANAHATGEYEFPPGQSIAQFHDYAIEWEPGEIRWYVDGRPFASRRSWWVSRKTGPDGRGTKATSEEDLLPWPAPFDRPFYVVMNVAVGGRFLGDPDASTAMPVEMLVDHVRVYEKEKGHGPIRPRGDEALPWREGDGS
jgi:beta-glucanase (GH16 family)